MVATSKLKRAQDRVVAARPYARGAARGHRRPVHAGAGRALPAAPAPGAAGEGRAQPRGGHPAHLQPRARRRVQREPDQGSAPADRASSRPRAYTVDLHGDRQEGHRLLPLPRPQARRRSGIDIGDRPTAEHAAEIVEPLIEALRRGRARRAWTWSRRSSSVALSDPAGDRADPAGRGAAGGGRRPRATTSWRRAPRRSSSELLPLYVRNAVYRGLVETAAAEHGARRTAMKNATDNAGEMLELLKRTYNRAAAGADHAGDRRDRRRRRGAAGITRLR